MEKSKTHEDLVADILAEIPDDVEVKANFPSRGKFYERLDESKPITIRPLTFDDERYISNLKIKSGEQVINAIISRCISNMNPEELLEMDKVYILVTIRQISFGSDFKARITCPKCSEITEASIDLTRLGVRKIPESFKNPRKAKLPVCKKDAMVRFPTQADEKYTKNSNVAAKNIWRFVDSIAGVTDKKVISDVIDRLPLQDIKALLKGIGGADYGIETSFIFECPDEYCGEETVMEVPFDEDFFTMN